MAIGFDEKELIKWMIERIEYEIDAFVNDRIRHREEFSSVSNEWKSKILNFRNYTLSTIGIVISTFISITSLFPDLIIFIIPVLMGGIIATFISLIIFSTWKIKGTNLLTLIDMAIMNSIEHLNIIKGFVASGSFDLDILNTKELYAIGQFVKVIGSNCIDIFYAYKTASKSIWLRNKESYLIQNTDNYLFLTKMAYDIFSLRSELMHENILKNFAQLLCGFNEKRPEIQTLYLKRFQS